MKLTVLFLGKKGGHCVFTYETVRNLLLEGCEIQLFLSSYIENKSDFESLKAQGRLALTYIKTYTGAFDFAFRTLNVFRFLKIAKKIKLFAPEWVYMPALSAWAGLVLAFAGKMRVAATIHDVSAHLGEENAILERLDSYAIKRSSKVVTLTQRFIPLIAQKYGLNEADIRWIRHGNYCYYRPADFRVKDFVTKKILFFGRIHEYKGISVLLDAMLAVKEKEPDIVLDIVGGMGSISAQDGEKIRRLGHACNVVNEYVPNEEIYKHFEDVDFVVLPYIEASQSGVVMLSYAFAKPVIVTDIGGLPEQVFDDTGLVIPANDAAALAVAILKMYDDPKKIVAMGRAAEEKNETVFSWRKSAKDLIAFLRG